MNVSFGGKRLAPNTDNHRERVKKVLRRLSGVRWNPLHLSEPRSRITLRLFCGASADQTPMILQHSRRQALGAGLFELGN
jgi:hypothetical protein